jgi:hypothetical protein
VFAPTQKLSKVTGTEKQEVLYSVQTMSYASEVKISLLKKRISQKKATTLA